MTPVFFDTGFVIALLNRQDKHHQAAVCWQRELVRAQRRRVTTTAVLLELGDGFAQKGRWATIAPFLVGVLRDPGVEVVPVDDGLIDRAVALRATRPDKSWGLTDCASFVVMQSRLMTEALASDHHFQQAGFRALLLER